MVGLYLHLLAGFGRCGRNRDDDAARILLPQRFDRGVHGGPGRQAIVHQDHGAATDIGRRTAAAVKALAPRQFLPLARRDRIDHLIGDAKLFNELIVEHAHAAGSNRTHRQLLVTGNSEFADDKNIERRAELARHLVGNGHAAAR